MLVVLSYLFQLQPTLICLCFVRHADKEYAEYPYYLLKVTENWSAKGGIPKKITADEDDYGQAWGKGSLVLKGHYLEKAVPRPEDPSACGANTSANDTAHAMADAGLLLRMVKETAIVKSHSVIMINVSLSKLMPKSSRRGDKRPDGILYTLTVDEHDRIKSNLAGNASDDWEDTYAAGFEGRGIDMAVDGRVHISDDENDGMQ
jgi:hypothetical protein